VTSRAVGECSSDPAEFRIYLLEEEQAVWLAMLSSFDRATPRNATGTLFLVTGAPGRLGPNPPVNAVLRPSSGLDSKN
jgi:hypothetical protein